MHAKAHSAAVLLALRASYFVVVTNPDRKELPAWCPIFKTPAALAKQIRWRKIQAGSVDNRKPANGDVSYE